MSNYIPYKITDGTYVITHPCHNVSWSMLVKGSQIWNAPSENSLVMSGVVLFLLSVHICITSIVSGLHSINTCKLSVYITGHLGGLHSIHASLLSAYYWHCQWPPQYKHEYTFCILLAPLVHGLHSIHTSILSVYYRQCQWPPQYKHEYAFCILPVFSVASTTIYRQESTFCLSLPFSVFPAIYTRSHFLYVAGIFRGIHSISTGIIIGLFNSLHIIHMGIRFEYYFHSQWPLQYIQEYTFCISLAFRLASIVYTPAYFLYITDLLNGIHNMHTGTLSVYYYVTGFLSGFHSIHTTILSVYCWPPQWTPHFTHHYTFGIYWPPQWTPQYTKPPYFPYIAGLLSDLHGIHTTILSVYCWPLQWPPQYTHHYTFGILLASSVDSTVYTPLYFRYIAGLLSDLHSIHTTILSVYCWTPQWPPQYTHHYTFGILLASSVTSTVTHHYTFGILLASSVTSTVYTPLYFRYIAGLLSELHSIHTTILSVYCWPPQWTPPYTHHYTFGI